MMMYQMKDLGYERKVEPAVPPVVDFQEGWCNGNKKILGVL